MPSRMSRPLIPFSSLAAAAQRYCWFIKTVANRLARSLSDNNERDNGRIKCGVIGPGECALAIIAIVPIETFENDSRGSSGRCARVSGQQCGSTCPASRRKKRPRLYEQREPDNGSWPSTMAQWLCGRPEKGRCWRSGRRRLIAVFPVYLHRHCAYTISGYYRRLRERWRWEEWRAFVPRSGFAKQRSIICN